MRRDVPRTGAGLMDAVETALAAARSGGAEWLARTLADEVARLRKVITEYVAEVESGEKFDALVCSVPGLTSDDGVYGAPLST